MWCKLYTAIIDGARGRTTATAEYNVANGMSIVLIELQ